MKKIIGTNLITRTLAKDINLQHTLQYTFRWALQSIRSQSKAISQRTTSKDHESQRLSDPLSFAMWHWLPIYCLLHSFWWTNKGMTAIHSFHTLVLIKLYNQPVNWQKKSYTNCEQQPSMGSLTATFLHVYSK